ncbi:OTU-domain-containing protein [Sistotremastrum niveocremeum HHB9708]|uniref:Ubiquitin thioesterase OTU n=1 Tax=Sistotremastrum niveocremeum HHB9708 TaxID=1314777 RepID=A0A164S160_9AGAM|nr:OTU-domain-containing protein [Sistotremastrum niveocremeum HHB9708]
MEINLDTASVEDLQAMVFSFTEIPPALQDLKLGYPPRSLTLVPELPITSLNLKPGDQLTVIESKGSNAVGGGGISHSSKPMNTSGSSTTQRGPSSLVGAAPGANRKVPASAPPIRAPPPASAKPSSSGPERVSIRSGTLIHRVVPDDNSCLFSSTGVVFEQNMSAAPRLRQVVAEAIKNDPITWNEAVLGRPRDEYISTILKPAAWGGAIELSIFASHYSTEIASIDVETGRIDRFGSESGYTSRCILLYSGIHYDAVSLAPMPDAPEDFHETKFDVSDQTVLDGASKLAGALRAKKAYTNTATFDLKCQVCGKGLKGEKEARSHASDTGHVEFGEY